MAVSRSIDGNELRRLSSKRWLAPILAHMTSENGSRFAAMARTLGMSKSVLSVHLDALERFGWIMRNPGHGHPLRPEYLLTAEGAQIAEHCVEITRVRAHLDLETRDLGRWSLPIIAELVPGPLRFTALQRRLDPVTPRALSLGLIQLAESRLIKHPPADLPAYALSQRGARIGALLRPET